MSGSRKKLRAIFLAFIMVTSVVAFAGVGAGFSQTTDSSGDASPTRGANDVQVLNVTLKSDDVLIDTDGSPGSADDGQQITRGDVAGTVTDGDSGLTADAIEPFQTGDSVYATDTTSSYSSNGIWQESTSGGGEDTNFIPFGFAQNTSSASTLEGTPNPVLGVDVNDDGANNVLLNNSGSVSASGVSTIGLNTSAGGSISDNNIVQIAGNNLSVDTASTPGDFSSDPVSDDTVDVTSSSSVSGDTIAGSTVTEFATGNIDTTTTIASSSNINNSGFSTDGDGDVTLNLAAGQTAPSTGIDKGDVLRIQDTSATTDILLVANQSVSGGSTFPSNDLEAVGPTGTTLTNGGSNDQSLNLVDGFSGNQRTTTTDPVFLNEFSDIATEIQTSSGQATNPITVSAPSANQFGINAFVINSTTRVNSPAGQAIGTSSVEIDSSTINLASGNNDVATTLGFSDDNPTDSNVGTDEFLADYEIADSPSVGISGSEITSSSPFRFEDQGNGAGTANDNYDDQEDIYIENDGTSGSHGAIYGEQLDTLTVSNDGTLASGEIAEVKLYRGSGAFDPNSDTLLRTVTSQQNLNQFELGGANGGSALNEDLGSGDGASGVNAATRFYVAVDLASDATAGDTIDMSVPNLQDVNGNSNFDVGSDRGLFLAGPDDTGSITDSSVQTVSTQGLPGEGDGSIDTSINGSAQQDIIAGSASQNLGTIRVRDVDSTESALASQTVLTMPSDVTIDTDASNVISSGSGSLSASTSSVTSDSITISHSSQSATGDTLKITGVVVNASGSISASETGTDNAINVQFSAGDFDSNLLSARTPGSDIAQATAPIGSTDNGLNQLDIRTTGVDGQLAAGTDLVVSLPSDSGVTFNTSQLSTNFPSGQDVDGDGNDELDAVSNTVNSSSSITVPITSQVNKSATISIDGLSVDVAKDASDVNLTVTTEPVNGLTTLDNSTAVTGGTSALQVNAPVLRTDATGGGSGADVLVGNDNDGEDSLDFSQTNGNEITIESGADDDIAEATVAKNITVSIPDSGAFVFDQGQDAPTVNNDGLGGTITPVIVDEQTLNITTNDAADATAGDSIDLSGMQYNTTGGEASTTKLNANINRSGVSFTSQNFINVTVAAVDDVRVDIDNDGTFATQDTGNAGVGTTQTALVQTRNLSNGNIDVGVGDVGAEAFGEADISLEANGTPSGASASDVSFNVSDSTVTTGSNGQGAVNITLGDATGDYNITATSPDDDTVNATLKYTAGAGAASQFNVTQVDNALIDDSGLNTPGEEEIAAFSVRVEDGNGNVNQSSAVDVSVSPSGDATLATERNNGVANYVGLATGINNGDPTGTPVNDTDDDGDFNYDTTGSGLQSGDDGKFFVFVKDSTAEDVDLTVSTSGISDTATTTVHDNVDNVDVAFNTTGSVINGSGVAATATLEANGSAIEVPRVDVDFNSTNTTVASSADAPFPTTVQTEDDGTALVNVSADAEGSADITATSQNTEGSNTLTITVEEDAPAYYTLELSHSIADRASQNTTNSTFSTHRKSGSTALLPRSVYRYTRTHTGGFR